MAKPNNCATCLLTILAVPVLVIGCTAGMAWLAKDIKLPPRTPWNEENDWIGAFLAVQDPVSRLLKSPATADFPSAWSEDIEQHVTPLGDQRYEIHSYVDSQNSFGALIRTYFVAVVQQVADDQWSVESLEFLDDE